MAEKQPSFLCGFRKFAFYFSNFPQLMPQTVENFGATKRAGMVRFLFALSYFVASIRSIPKYLRKTSGTVTEPSAF